MGFFSKLFKADGEPEESPAPAPEPARARPKKTAAQAAGDSSPTAAADVSANATATPAPAPAERELKRPATKSPLPSPPRPPLGAAAPPPLGVAAPAPPMPAPPPPVGAAPVTAAARGTITTPNAPFAAAAGPQRTGQRAVVPPMPVPSGAQAASARATKRKTPTTERWVASPQATVMVSDQRSDAASDNGAGTAEPPRETAATPEPAAEEQPTQRMKVDRLPGDAVDAAIDRLLDHSSAPPGRDKDALRAEAERAADQRAAAETFISLLAAGIAQVRELMSQLPVGRTPRHWAASCRPVIAPFLDGARQIELVELTAALEQLDAALERAADEVGAYVGPEACSAIARAYTQLAAQLPDEVALPSQGDGRRLLVLESLLLQVPALHRRTLNKLYGAGLGSLEQLSGASPDEIAAVAGIDASMAEGIAERVQRFERERSQQSPLELRNRALERVRAALTRLGEHQEQFERAELEEAAERKREARRAREIAACELDLLLSEIGELPLIEELKRCGVRNKIRRVESYLEHAQSAS